MNSNHEKVPYPPAYTEIYPSVPANGMNPTNMGWQPPTTNEIVMPQQPPSVTQAGYMTQPTVTSVIMQDQSRVGLYPLKLQPCPHCQTESKTMIKQEASLRTHLLALILCVTCCCCCVPFAYITDNMTKTANHFCENCKAYIGSYNRKLCK